MKLSQIAAAACLCLTSLIASAAPVSITQNDVLTTGGQDMSFVFNGLAPSNGAGGMITISPSGGRITGLDLSGAFPLEAEHFEVTFDGVSQGFYSCGGASNNGSTAIGGATDNSGNFNDCVFSLSLGLADSFLADGLLTVGVLFGADVSTFSHDDVVNVALDYDSGSRIPEPASLALVSLALLGAAATRRKAR
ncbi:MULTISPECIES: PEP-CTERM sorting domain-containing protein [unclassified Roseateles]|uniref:PEP-CTERM sorting domain-containing protein n=1 Tax=unclassified Roseateles TaxID=2626991 RepID=UPI0007131327|nr:MULTISPECIES: PEP-CTERM sorting domain-containing protein [unclassified Roseateles]KQW45772.1 hypothetical protein ASC81_12860 [Pelomonas sp. Root405]KRA72616.1 hypothetical protein ASD88_12860 [Pelomonas sp. Root662]